MARSNTPLPSTASVFRFTEFQTRTCACRHTRERHTCGTNESPKKAHTTNTESGVCSCSYFACSLIVSRHLPGGHRYLVRMQRDAASADTHQNEQNRVE